MVWFNSDGQRVPMSSVDNLTLKYFQQDSNLIFPRLSASQSNSHHVDEDHAAFIFA